MKSWLIAPLSGLALAITPAFANAASFSSPVSEINPPVRTDLQPPVLALPPIPGFNPATIPGGTDPAFAITNLVVTYTATSDAGLTTFTNNASNPNSFTLARDLNFSVDGPGTSLDATEADFGFLNINIPTPVIPVGGDYSVDPPAQVGVVTKTISCPSVDGCSPSDPLFAPFFLPNGPLNFYASTSTVDTIIGGGGNANINTSTFAGLKVQLTLNYLGPSGDTSVPEPSSLLGLGLFGLGLGSTVLRKKKKA
jgi:hypothetical protein